MTITYCKGLPTYPEEMNALGQTNFEMFLQAFSKIFHQATCETVNHLLQVTQFNKSKWNSYLQQKYQINKRHANSVINFASGKVESSSECRKNHLKQLKGKLKSIEEWIASGKKKLKLAQKFYRNKNWVNSKKGCNFPLATFLEPKKTNWQRLKFQLHQKKRKAYLIKKLIKHLQGLPIRVKVPKTQVFAVGSKDETLGNQICQWDGMELKFRVPACLEAKFGNYISTKIGNFERNINRLPVGGAKTWHFYKKENKWCVAVQFTPLPVPRLSDDSASGTIGIDLNPGSIGWAYIDREGNLKAHGQIPLVQGLPSGKQEAQIVAACLELVTLAHSFVCPIVCEELDFSQKKEQLKEKGRKYARMLSGWAYSRFYELLKSILDNRGICLIKVNPAYTSIIGLVKYARQFGLASDEAAAIAIARRGMKLKEKLPNVFRAYLGVNPSKHSWHWWGKLNSLLKEFGVSCRQDYYAISNWESKVKLF